MRVREYSSDQSVQVYLRNINNLTGVDSAYVGPLSIGPEESESVKTTDVVTPQFRLRQKRGEIIMNPYTNVRSNIRAFAGAMRYTLTERRNSDNVVTQSGTVYSVGPWSSRQRAPRVPMALMTSVQLAAELAQYGMGSIESKKQLALAQALDQSSGAAAAALVTIAELDKTVDLFRNGVALVNKSVNLLESLPSTTRQRLNTLLGRLARARSGGMRRQILNTVGSSLRGIASNWLGYRYGIMATYYDLSSWVTASNTSKRTRFVANAFDEFESVGTLATTFSSNYVNYKEAVTRRRRSTIRAGVLIDNKAITSADRFGANRLLSTAWELVPFSFVVDWFADVGTRLSAWEGGLFVRPLGSWISIEHRFQYVHEYRSEWKTTNSGTYTYFGSGSDDGITEDRSVMRERIANPNLSPIPQINVQLNWKRMADSAALVTVLSRRLKRLL